MWHPASKLGIVISVTPSRSKRQKPGPQEGPVLPYHDKNWHRNWQAWSKFLRTVPCRISSLPHEGKCQSSPTRQRYGIGRENMKIWEAENGNNFHNLRLKWRPFARFQFATPSIAAIRYRLTVSSHGKIPQVRYVELFRRGVNFRPIHV